ncbi:MAG: T9SS type A sorting domain-containing protein [Bacteroidetes bacterium]|nr:T9SS type A sorting domain-containing protein [Bacteroidota bacterium]
MYKKLLLFLFIGVHVSVFSQTTDSVSTGLQNANDVYYSFSTGIVKTQPINNWDIAFEISGYTASILVNQAKGNELYQTPFSIAQWSSFDTTSFKSFKRMFNSEYTWALGAFNRHTDNNYDLGWGTYNTSTHVIAGDSIFLIKLSDGTLKKITILNLTSGVYNFKYASIDGSNEKTASIAKSNFKNKNFAYYSLSGDSSIDREPLTSDWDLVFTKYTVFIPTPYNVAGVWTNKNTKTAKATKVPTGIMSFSGYNFSDTNSVIGYNWKKYNASLGKYSITDSLVFFVNTSKNNYYKIYFTGYAGGSQGKYYFVHQSIAASVNKISKANITIFPNPVSEELNISTNGQILSYNIKNLEGKSVLVGNDSTINTAILAKGFYILNVNTSEGNTFVKFLKD